MTERSKARRRHRIAEYSSLSHWALLRLAVRRSPARCPASTRRLSATRNPLCLLAVGAFLRSLRAGAPPTCLTAASAVVGRGRVFRPTALRRGCSVGLLPSPGRGGGSLRPGVTLLPIGTLTDAGSQFIQSSVGPAAVHTILSPGGRAFFGASSMRAEDLMQIHIRPSRCPAAALKVSSHAVVGPFSEPSHES